MPDLPLRPAPETGAEKQQQPGLQGRGWGWGWREVGGEARKVSIWAMAGVGADAVGQGGGQRRKKEVVWRDCPQGQVIGKGIVDGKFQKGSMGQGAGAARAWRAES